MDTTTDIGTQLHRLIEQMFHKETHIHHWLCITASRGQEMFVG